MGLQLRQLQILLSTDRAARAWPLEPGNFSAAVAHFAQGFGTPHRARSEVIPPSPTRLNRTGALARKRCRNQPLTRVTVLFAHDRDDYLDDLRAVLADLGVEQVLAVGQIAQRGGLTDDDLVQGEIGKDQER